LECFPLPNQNSEIVAKTLVDGFFSRFGCALELHTDQGRNMDGNVIRCLCDILEVAKTRTTPYRPASNGQVERYNRMILDALRCFIKKNQGSWDLHLQQLAGAIRATHHRQTGFTPNYLMLGREVLQPLDLLLGTTQFKETEQEPAEYLKNLVDTQQTAHQLAREHLRASQLRQKRDYDLRLNQKKFNVGDVVVKVDSATKVGQCAKLKPPWKGPYVISKVLSPVLFKIQDRRGESVIHHDRLKMCQLRNPPIWLQRLRNDILKTQPENEEGNENHRKPSDEKNGDEETEGEENGRIREEEETDEVQRNEGRAEEDDDAEGRDTDDESIDAERGDNDEEISGRNDVHSNEGTPLASCRRRRPPKYLNDYLLEDSS